MATLRGGRNRKGVEFVSNIFDTNTATATSTTTTSTNYVACQGAKAVYFIIYDKTHAASTAFTSATPLCLTHPQGSAFSAANVGGGVNYISPGNGVTASNGGVLAVYGASHTTPTSVTAPNVIPVYALGCTVTWGAGVTPANIACDAVIVWN